MFFFSLACVWWWSVNKPKNVSTLIIKYHSNAMVIDYPLTHILIYNRPVKSKSYIIPLSISCFSKLSFLPWRTPIYTVCISESVVTILGVGVPEESWFDFWQKIEDSTIVWTVQIRWGADTASYRTFSGNCCPWGKSAKVLIWAGPHLVMWRRMCGAIHSHFHTPSWQAQGQVIGRH